MIPEGVEARSQCPSAAAWRGHPSGYDRRAEVGGWGFGNLLHETREESWRFSSGGSAALGACRTAPYRCRPSPATSTHPNRCCDSHRQSACGWCHVSAVHGPRYCNGCQGSGPDLDRRPASLDLSTMYLLEEELAWRGLIHVSRIASRHLRSPHLCHRFALRKQLKINIITYYDVLIHIMAPWMALPKRRAVSFRRACVMSVPSAESRWLTFDPGPFTFILCEVSAASPLQLIRLPHLMISDAPCTIEWIFSLQKYRRSPRFLNGNMMAHIEMNFRARASRRSRALIFIPSDVLLWRIIRHYYIIKQCALPVQAIPFQQHQYPRNQVRCRTFVSCTV